MTGLLVQTSAPAIHVPDIRETVSLRDFYQQAANVRVPTNPNLFMPDSWGKIFAKGLTCLSQKPAFADAHVLEVGVGTGINALGIMTSPGAPQHYTGTDICKNAVDATTHLAKANGLHNITAIQSDLLKDVPDVTLANARHIVACIPQVPETNNAKILCGDGFAHYYNPNGRPEDWNHFGLGLNAALIQEATERAPHASITLNLAGRPGIERLAQMFEAYGRKAEILHVQMVPQHAETKLTSLADLERLGVSNFEFYKDEKGTQPIGAVEAEERREKESLFHNVYVLHAPGL
ncbi:MAG: 50S ribosomal protein L11 methyltransferase [Alphaproteobacteria bacterium]|nr:50S ribosomal protein L11 methyltransferase [Alphaproteobacteria bacterium]